MPELPEVECVRLTLEDQVLGARVTRALLHRRDILIAPGDPRGGFSRQAAWKSLDIQQRVKGLGARKLKAATYTPKDLLEGCTIKRLIRRGKQLGVIGECDPEPGAGGTDGERALIFQLGMSGQVLVEEGSRKPRGMTHAHLELRVETRSGEPRVVIFRDPRRFGGVRVMRSHAELLEHWEAVGPDALAITYRQLAPALRKANRAVKAAIMDQDILAGVGNIYADEALFLAGIDPRTLASKLTPPRVKKLAAAIPKVLNKAICSGGSTLRDYRDARGRKGEAQLEHLVYGRGGEPCVRCGTRLKQGTVAQRTTVWCPQCQK